MRRAGCHFRELTLPRPDGFSTRMSRWRSTTAFLIGIVFTAAASAQVTLWTAGADLTANEAVTATETDNPNATSPAWSYGHRATLGSTSLTLMTAGEHVNSGSYTLEGFAGADFLSMRANVGVASVNIPGLLAVAPQEILMHPSSTEYAVVRWTAPAAASYYVSAYWRPVEPHGGANGGTGDIVVNGVSIYNTSWANGGAQANSGTLTLSLGLGDTVDFVLGNAGEYSYDAVAFDATVSVVPEPSSYALAAGMITLSGVAWRRRRSLG